MVGQGGGEAQGVTDPPPKKKMSNLKLSEIKFHEIDPT
jgi:hypothetical protein